MNIKSFSNLRWGIFSKYRNELFGISIITIMLLHYCNDLAGTSEAPRLLQQVAAAWKIIIGSTGVDCFLFLSGMGLYFSMQKDSRIIFFFKRRFNRSVLPYLIYGFVYWVLYDLVIKQVSIRRFCVDYSLLAFWVSNKHQFWYLSMCFFLYFLFPFVYRVIFTKDLAKQKHREIMLFICLVVGVTLIAILIPQFYKRTEIGLCRIPIFFLGCVVGRYVKNNKEMRYPLVWLLFGILLRGVSLVTKKLVSNTLFFSTSFPLNRWILSCYAFSLMLLCISCFEIFKFDKIRRFLRWIGSYSLELYITHVSVRILLHAIGIQTYRPITHFFCVYLISMLLSIGLRRLINAINPSRGLQ